MNEDTNCKTSRRRGSGPRTQAGKRKAAANRLRHGLAAAVGTDPAVTAHAARIAAALAGCGRFRRRPDLIEAAAEAEAEVLRARAAGVALINRAMASLPDGPNREAEAIAQALPDLLRVNRYEVRAMGRRNRALRLLRRDATLGY